MSRYSKGLNFDCNKVVFGGEGGNVDLVCSNPNGKVFVNGIEPGAGGSGGSPPISGTGDITITGNAFISGDGTNTGKIEGQTIKSIDNIVISSGSLEVTTGGVDIKGNGNLTLEGNGNINQQGTGKITSGSGGIESEGDIKTIGAHDLEIGQDIYFDGNDIYHRTINPTGQQSYKDYKQLAGKNDNNVFTGSNQFNSNTTEFAAKVSVGTRDGGGFFTQNLALNTSGNIESKTINNGTTIQCGNINCGNAGLNEVRARLYGTRTNENNSPAGWTIEQETPNVPAQQVDRILQIKGGEANAFITITDNANAGFIPNIVLDPRTSALGGLIAATTYEVGEGTEAFKLEQPTTGTEINSLLIKAGSNEGQVKFQNNAGTIDLAIIQKDSVTNQGRLYCPAIFFGTTGLHNSIVNDTSGADSLVLKIKQATASSKVEFLDNTATSVMEVKKDEIELGPTIPILYGAYSFRPVQYTLTNASFPIEQTEAAFTKIFTSFSSFTNVNTGATGQSLVEGFYKLSVTQTGASTPNGTYEKLGVLCDYVYRVPSDASPDNQLPNPLSFSYGKYDTTGPPEIEIRRSALGAQDIHMTFPTLSGSSGESMPITVKLTKLDF